MGIQERLVLQRKAAEAEERGEPIPDLPGMKEALADKDLYKKKEEIARNNKALMGNRSKNLEMQNSRKTST